MSKYRGTPIRVYRVHAHDDYFWAVRIGQVRRLMLDWEVAVEYAFIAASFLPERTPA